MHSALTAITFILLALASQPIYARPHNTGNNKRALVGRKPGNKVHKQFRRTTVKRSSSTTTAQPSTLPPGTATAAEGCTQWITPSAGDSCLSLITYSPGMILSDFLDLNPDLASDCHNLEIGSWYCVDTDDDHSDSNKPRIHNAVASKGSTCRGGKTSATLMSQATATVTASSTAFARATPSAALNSTGNAVSGLLKLTDATCGYSNPSSQASATGGVNGALDWLNCGISKSDPTSGWIIPKVVMKNIIYQDLDPNGIYSACSNYTDIFESAGQANGLPPILLAAFAMQESSCNPNASGDSGGAFGLMQITEDKCGNAPGGNCNDPEYNINTAAAYFASVLNGQCAGNPLCAVGAYNGWNSGMSYDSAVAAAYTSCCECQNNLDYLNQFFNGWLQNINGQTMVHYNNLGSCTH